jgi:hypothetical protein
MPPVVSLSIPRPITEHKRAAQNRVASLVRGISPECVRRIHRRKTPAMIRQRFGPNPRR